MSLYTTPALNAVNFALSTHTTPSIASPQNVLTAYVLPALAAVNFALTAYTLPTYPDVGWELLPVVSFPTQYPGLRGYDATVMELCLVAVADAPSGMGGVPMLRKNGVTYAVYLVETSDPNASTFRFRTSAGTKAVRLKT